MSKSVAVIFGDAMFWAYDVALGVLFIEATRVGADAPTDVRPSWWPELERDLRTHAVAGSSFAVLLDDFDEDRRQMLLHCVVEAARRLKARGGVHKAEVSTWPELEESADNFLRGAEHINPAPLVDLAEALVALAAGTLPPAPPGQTWYYGTPEGRITLRAPPEDAQSGERHSHRRPSGPNTSTRSER
ncbi:hypothetical protein HUT06_36500 [Actinomadura sp. NAK00032]|uniref:hypothetical protein n=1 Tax=Actinomadura sp. NAK00032 TaxID=2742128 RepID=UPI00158FF6D0|nr:hypothetical protein [Actinomadura sp. NAK00032]QKW38848.1 hypothetical protein HUT06_36500 [Actinomadura sp. NAK00032]